MSVLSILVTLVVVGLILYLVNTYIPMDAKIKAILNIVVFIIVMIWLLQATGLVGPLEQIRIR